jgi:hypothetical protein
MQRYLSVFIQYQWLFWGIVVCILAMSCVWFLPFRGLTGDYFDNLEWRGTPVFSRRETRLTLESLEKGQNSFPQHNFSVTWFGWIYIEKEGDYSFSTKSDDGSSIFINDAMVLDNGGFHGPQKASGEIFLSKGFHSIRINYFQAVGSYELKVFWKTPEGTETILPSTVLFTSKKAGIFLYYLKPIYVLFWTLFLLLAIKRCVTSPRIKHIIQYFCFPSEYAPKRQNILAIGLLCLTIWSFWGSLRLSGTIKAIPRYTSSDLMPIKDSTWLNMWYWLDFGHYYRYSPTALIMVGKIDRHLVAPLLGIEFPSNEFKRPTRLIPVYIFLIGLVSCLTYWLARLLSLNALSAFAAALFIGVFKGWGYGFRYANIIIAITLMVIYGISVLLFWVYYLQKRQKIYLAGYILSFLLLIGAWDQWVNFGAFMILFSLLLLIKNKTIDRDVIIYGVLIPVLLFASYFAFRYPTMRLEVSKQAAEAQYVFSYPSLALMFEEMVVNASYHVSDVVEPLLFPWPMLSNAALNSYDMDIYNPYNKKYTEHSVSHYVTFTDWYAGLLFAFFLCAMVYLIRNLWKNKDVNGQSTYQIGIGLLLVYAGFLTHLPVMNRAYFLLPQWIGMLGYKHMFSVLGFSILIGWGIEKLFCRFEKLTVRFSLLISFCVWIIFCNYSKIKLAEPFLWISQAR